MLLLNIQEALGLDYNEALDSSLLIIKAMLMEYSYMMKERHSAPTEDKHGEFEWIELPDWDNPGETIRMKKYTDVGSFLG